MMGGDRDPPEGQRQGCGARPYDGNRAREEPYIQRIALNSDSDSPLQTARNDYYDTRACRGDPFFRLRCRWKVDLVC